MLARTLIVITLVLASFGTQARDNGQYAQVSPDIKRWVEGLTDDKGRGCCATADGFRPEEVEWDMSENAYRVLISGQWFTVPDGAVIKQANRIGYALVWYYFDNGALTIRCFLPGSGA
jgi:sugar lactone lactonase YvrE